MGVWQWVNDEIKEEILKISLDKLQWKCIHRKSTGCSKTNPKKKVHSDTELSQKNEKNLK